MLTIYPTLYERLGTLLLDEVDSKEYYSGDILFEDDQFDYTFNSTLLLRYAEHDYPEGITTELVDIQPIWWEFHSVGEDGEVLNDFDFTLLKRAVCR